VAILAGKVSNRAMFWFHQSLGFSTRTVESTFSNPDHGDQRIKSFVMFSI
jgi:hypothetical protein